MSTLGCRHVPAIFGGVAAAAFFSLWFTGCAAPGEPVGPITVSVSTVPYEQVLAALRESMTEKFSTGSLVFRFELKPQPSPDDLQTDWVRTIEGVSIEDDYRTRIRAHIVSRQPLRIRLFAEKEMRGPGMPIHWIPIGGDPWIQQELVEHLAHRLSGVPLTPEPSP